MPDPRPRSLTGALLLSWFVPGAGHLYLGIRERGGRFLAIYLAIAIPTWTAFVLWGPLPALPGALPALVVWIHAQRDLRRMLGLRWPALPPTGPLMIDAIRGRDRFYFPADPLRSGPERPDQPASAGPPELPPKRGVVPDDVGAWIDVAVMLLIAGFGVALTVVVTAGGGTPVEIALVVVLGAASTFQWAYTSYAWDKLRRRTFRS